MGNIRPDKFTWNKGDLVFDKKTSVPVQLKPVIEGLPKDTKKIPDYLSRAISSKRITLGDYRLILQIIQTPKPYKYE